MDAVNRRFRLRSQPRPLTPCRPIDEIISAHRTRLIVANREATMVGNHLSSWRCEVRFGSCSFTRWPSGGAELLMLNLIRRMDRSRFAHGTLLPEIAGRGRRVRFPGRFRPSVTCCGTSLTPRASAIGPPDAPPGIDAIVTVGAGDKMFWGRLAARLAGVPVVVCAIHSTGWPDRIGRVNRLGRDQ